MTPDPSLRGTCREAAEAACAADPALTLVRGWYHDPDWGTQEHWWARRPDGEIVDPTAAQFPHGGIAAWYEEFQGVFECEECGREVCEEDAYLGDGALVTCSARCFGRMVGLL